MARPAAFFQGTSAGITVSASEHSSAHDTLGRSARGQAGGKRRARSTGTDIDQVSKRQRVGGFTGVGDGGDESNDAELRDAGGGGDVDGGGVGGGRGKRLYSADVVSSKERRLQTKKGSASMVEADDNSDNEVAAAGERFTGVRALSSGDGGGDNESSNAGDGKEGDESDEEGANIAVSVSENGGGVISRSISAANASRGDLKSFSELLAPMPDAGAAVETIEQTRTRVLRGFDAVLNKDGVDIDGATCPMAIKKKILLDAVRVVKHYGAYHAEIDNLRMRFALYSRMSAKRTMLVNAFVGAGCGELALQLGLDVPKDPAAFHRSIFQKARENVREEVEHIARVAFVASLMHYLASDNRALRAELVTTAAACPWILEGASDYLSGMAKRKLQFLFEEVEVGQKEREKVVRDYQAGGGTGAAAQPERSSRRGARQATVANAAPSTSDSRAVSDKVSVQKSGADAGATTGIIGTSHEASLGALRADTTALAGPAEPAAEALVALSLVRPIGAVQKTKDVPAAKPAAPTLSQVARDSMPGSTASSVRRQASEGTTHPRAALSPTAVLPITAASLVTTLTPAAALAGGASDSADIGPTARAQDAQPALSGLRAEGADQLAGQGVTPLAFSAAQENVLAVGVSPAVQAVANRTLEMIVSQVKGEYAQEMHVLQGRIAALVDAAGESARMYAAKEAQWLENVSRERAMTEKAQQELRSARAETLAAQEAVVATNRKIEAAHKALAEVEAVRTNLTRLEDRLSSVVSMLRNCDFGNSR